MPTIDEEEAEPAEGRQEPPVCDFLWNSLEQAMEDPLGPNNLWREANNTVKTPRGVRWPTQLGPPPFINAKLHPMWRAMSACGDGGIIQPNGAILFMDWVRAPESKQKQVFDVYYVDSNQDTPANRELEHADHPEWVWPQTRN